MLTNMKFQRGVGRDIDISGQVFYFEFITAWICLDFFLVILFFSWLFFCRF